MNGVINAAFPLLNAIDRLLQALSLNAFSRVTFWGAISAALAMLFYTLLSNQQAIQQQKQAMRRSRASLSAAGEADPSVAVQLAFANLKEAFRLLGMVIVPSLLSAIPVVIVLFWIGTAYTYDTTSEDAPLAFRILPQNESAMIRAASGVTLPHSEGVHRLSAPIGGSVTVLVDGQVDFEGNVNDPPVGIIHKRKWWNVLLGNPAGYLQSDSAIDRIEIDRDRLVILPGVPGWLSTWEFTFFFSLIVVALALKILLRIE